MNLGETASLCLSNTEADVLFCASVTKTEIPHADGCWLNDTFELSIQSTSMNVQKIESSIINSP